jgi:uncharacterized phiE125 gp8 family phage protein
VNLIVVTEPPVEPVTLEDIYTFLRMDPEGSPPEHPDDVMLEQMIRSGREKVEQATRRALVQQRIRMVGNGFPRRCVRGPDEDFDFYHDAPIELLRPPFAEIHSVSYYDTENEQQVLDASTYFVASDLLVAQLQMKDGFDWPDTYRRSDAIQIEYTVGYPPSGSPPDDYRANVPASLKRAVCCEVQLQYDELSPEKRKDITETIARLERSFVIPRF